MPTNIDLNFTLKAENGQFREKLRESENDLKAMGEKMFDKKALGDPGTEAKKFLEQFGKGIDSMKNDKRFDILGQLFSKMDDPSLSMQTKMKNAKRIETMLEDMDLVMRNKMRVFQDKGKLAGFSPEAITKGMEYRLGQTGEMWMNAGQYASEMRGAYGGGGSGGAGGGVMGGNRAGGNDAAQVTQYAKKAALYLIGYMVSDAIKNTGAMYQSLQMTDANIFQRAGTTFDMSSIMQTSLQTSGMHRENIMMGLHSRKAGYESGGQMAGLLSGIIVGGLLASATGGLSMGIAPMIGSSVGSELGGIYGTGDITDEMRKQTSEIAKDKMVGQLMGIASQRVGVYDQMDVARAKFGARSGTTDIGGTGTGYTEAERYSLGLQQEGITGHFNKKTFTDQLRFSRAYGYDPSQIFSAGISTRYTGEEVGASGLYARKELAEKTGMGTRLPELIQALNSLSVVMTKVGANVTDASVLQSANLPYMLFGDTARGRMGDLGMETLMGVNSIFQQAPGSAGDAFLYQALKPKSLQEFDLMKEKGVFDKDNLSNVIEYAGQFGGRPMADRLFKGMGMQSASLRKAFTDNAFNEDGTVNKEFMEQFEKIDINTEEGTRQAAELLQVSKDAISGAEHHKDDMVAAMVKSGKEIADSVRSMQLKDIEEQNKVLKDQQVWEIITTSFNKGVFDFREAVNRLLGIESDNGKASNWNILTGDQGRAGLNKLSKGADYEIIESQHMPSGGDALYFPLSDAPRVLDKGTEFERSFQKYLKIPKGSLERLGYGKDVNVGDMQKNIGEILANKAATNTLSEENILKGQGGKGGGMGGDDPIGAVEAIKKATYEIKNPFGKIADGTMMNNGVPLTTNNVIHMAQQLQKRGTMDSKKMLLRHYLGTDAIPVSQREKKELQKVAEGDSSSQYAQDLWNDFAWFTNVTQPDKYKKGVPKEWYFKTAYEHYPELFGSIPENSRLYGTSYDPISALRDPTADNMILYQDPENLQKLQEAVYGYPTVGKLSMNSKKQRYENFTAMKRQILGRDWTVDDGVYHRLAAPKSVRNWADMLTRETGMSFINGRFQYATGNYPSLTEGFLERDNMGSTSTHDHGFYPSSRFGNFQGHSHPDRSGLGIYDNHPTDPSDADRENAPYYQSSYIINQREGLLRIGETENQDMLAPGYFDQENLGKKMYPYKDGGEGQGGANIVININAADRALMHSELDKHLDDLAKMAHPTKLADNF